MSQSSQTSLVSTWMVVPFLHFTSMLEFDGEGAVVKKLETYFRRQDRVIRFITVKNDKYAAEYAAKRRSLKAPKTEEA